MRILAITQNWIFVSLVTFAARKRRAPETTAAAPAASFSRAAGAVMQLSRLHECPASPAPRRSSRVAAVVTMAIVLVGRCLCAAEETEGRAEAREWFARHFGADSRQAPFSFVYGDRPSANLLPTWQTKTARDRHDSVRTQRKLTWI